MPLLPFRPFKYIKRFLPKTLFARSILIILTPLILVQGVTTYVFIERHWSWVTKHIARTISAQVVTTLEMIETNNPLLGSAAYRFALEIETRPVSSGPLPNFEKRSEAYGWDEAYLHSILAESLQRPFRVRMNKDLIHIETVVGSKFVHLQTARKRVFAKTTPIFLMWALGTPVIFFIIAAIFMRNQVRPIRRLANAAYLFGKNQLVSPFKPEGAFEVRKAGIAFNQMKERIERQITQRTQMLAGVSHDLRTPLTRMELQLAMMGNSKDIQGLQADIKEMTRTIDEYIAFAKGDEPEASKSVNLTALLKTIIKKIRTSSVAYDLDLPKSLRILARKHAVERCLTNILLNAQNHGGDKIWISGHKDEENVYINIEDNGPGIPQDKQKEVLQPFYRLETSRNRTTGGSGLGLAIACDIVIAHGGTIDLRDSAKGGVCVELMFPV